MRARLLQAHNPSPWTGPTGNNTYLFTGAVPTLVDAGVGHEAHVTAIAAALDGRPLAQVLVTHGHADHLSGADALRARWPAVRILKRLPSLDRGEQPLDDGASILAGDSPLQVVATPGHSTDHACFVDPE